MKKNYVPESISFAEGFTSGRINSELAIALGKPFMLVDKAKAIKIVEGLVGEGRDIDYAELGLDGDWQENSGKLYEYNKFQECYVDGEEPEDKFYDIYRGSCWATPTLIVYFNDGPSEAYECWKPRED